MQSHAASARGPINAPPLPSLSDQLHLLILTSAPLSLISLYRPLQDSHSIKMPVHISTHPLIQAKLSQLRSSSTAPRDVRTLVGEISTMLGVEALANLPFEAPGKSVRFPPYFHCHFLVANEWLVYNVIGHNSPGQTVYNHRDQHVQHSNHSNSKSGIGYG